MAWDVVGCLLSGRETDPVNSGRRLSMAGRVSVCVSKTHLPIAVYRVAAGLPTWK